jgi:anthranilate synthase component 1
MSSDFSPSLEDFSKTYEQGKSQLVWTQISGDLETPVSAYLKLCRDEPYCFLLESVEGGQTLGRYSIIGFDPDLIWMCCFGVVRIWNDYGGWETENTEARDSIRNILADSKIDVIEDGMPPMVAPGLFGYLGYDMVRLVEDIPDDNPNDLEIPDSVLIRPTTLLVFDNVKSKLWLVTPAYQHKDNSNEAAQEAYRNACDKLSAVLAQLKMQVDPTLTSHKSKVTLPLDVQSNMSPAQYKEAVEKTVDYIHQGEAFQVVIGQRFSADFDLPSFELYRSLRQLNPSPFMFHLSYEGFSLVGASPEILVRVRDGKVSVRPLAGTRKRGETEEEDKALAEELLADPKECAEHLMLLDLGRNDVGRVAKIGSLEIPQKFNVERYSHVMHIASQVDGTLREDLDILDALFAGFPAGTLSGAPKVRAMEIIDELEISRRSYYGGAAGYLSSNGELDTCITLRTALIKDGKLHIQASGGIVADSNPDDEYEETVNKAKATIRAAEIAIEHSS